jgi:hypothetical protein
MTSARKRLLAIAEAIKAGAGVMKHHVLAKPDRAGGRYRYGWSFPRRGIIHAPAGHTDRDLYTLAHECAHVALRHDHRKPLWRREFEAELWAHAALRRHGIPVHEYDKGNACLNVFNCIDDAVERGRFGRPKRIAEEAAEWSGWNLYLAMEADNPISE